MKYTLPIMYITSSIMHIQSAPEKIKFFLAQRRELGRAHVLRSLLRRLCAGYYRRHAVKIQHVFQRDLRQRRSSESLAYLARKFRNALLVVSWHASSYISFFENAFRIMLACKQSVGHRLAHDHGYAAPLRRLHHLVVSRVDYVEYALHAVDVFKRGYAFLKSEY